MNKLARCQPLLGTYVEISIDAYASDKELIRVSTLAFGIIKRIQYLMSFHDTTSELSLINHKAYSDNGCYISIETSEVLNMCLSLSLASNGVFDPCIAPELIKQGLLPQHDYSLGEKYSYKNIVLEKQHVKFTAPLLLDLGGIAKGYAVDKAMALIKNQLNNKLKNAVINAGGDLMMHEWKNKVINVVISKEKIKKFKMQAPAIATSGHYYLNGDSAIIDPSNKNQVKLKQSVSVFANSCMLADGLTKVAAVDGVDNLIFEENNAFLIA